MSNETLFYICGGILAASAVVVSVVGLKLPKFPGKALPLVILWFAMFVVSATTFAVLHAQDEQKAKAAELEKAGEEIESGQTSGPYENEGGAQGGESEKGEREAEEEAKGSAQGEEPVGPTENETGKKPSNKGGEKAGSKKAAGAGGASTTLQLEASPTELAFNTTQLSAKAGKVTIDFTNPSPIPHDVVIEQNGKELAGTEEITESKASASANLKPGTYTFFCSVPGHRQAGMEGTLVVK
jgi:plastocyanin